MFRKLIATDNDTATAVFDWCSESSLRPRARRCSGGSVVRLHRHDGLLTGVLHIPAYSHFWPRGGFFGGLGLIFGLLARVAAFGVFCN